MRYINNWWNILHKLIGNAYIHDESAPPTYIINCDYIYTHRERVWLFASCLFIIVMRDSLLHLNSHAVSYLSHR